MDRNKIRATVIQFLPINATKANIIDATIIAMELARKLEIAQIQAENLKLREALNSASHYVHTNSVLHKIIVELLASTPAQSLQDHDDEVIELCAREADARFIENCQYNGNFIAIKIRELKGTL